MFVPLKTIAFCWNAARDWEENAMGEELELRPENPRGGRTLIVDAEDPRCYPIPSDALKDAGE